MAVSHKPKKDRKKQSTSCTARGCKNRAFTTVKGKGLRCPDHGGRG